MSISFLTSPSSLTPKSALLTFLLLSCVKWLLVPSYRSTDFDVHRNWLALTRHVPVKDWYYDDVNGTTVHTLDYPPLFAFFEYALSNNVITSKMLEHGWLDVRCLESIPDASSNDPPPSEACVKFHRGTVIFVGDVIFFVGAYLATNSMSSLGEDGCERASSYFTFASLVSNPGIVMLDHVHFQYNGMLLGVLLISISCMVRGGAWGSLSSLSSSSSSSSSSKLHTNNGRRWELLSAATFAGLLATKHLFLTLAPLYFFYLLGRHCFIIVGAEEKTKGNIIGIDKYKDGEGAIAVVLRFSWSRLLVLAAVSLLCLFGPFVPFLIQPDPMGQMRQILKRLFPFGRGLVHDYWAANIWALYIFVGKIATLALRKAPPIIPGSIRGCLEYVIPFPEPPPWLVALLLLIGLWPGGIDMAWKVGRSSLTKPLYNPGKFFIHAVVFCSMSSFMLGYHVHEKAIMTAIVPLTLLASNTRHMARLFIRTCMFGLFGILPLLFRPQELLFKATLYIGWMCGVTYALDAIHHDSTGGGRRRRTILTTVDIASSVILACVLIFMDIVHPLIFVPSGRLEFLPLMITSVVCAVGLVWCWLESCRQMIFGSVRVAWR